MRAGPVAPRTVAGVHPTAPANAEVRIGAAHDIPLLITGASRLIWDFDGVVFDTEPAHHATFETVLRRYDVDLADDWFAVGVSEPDRWRDWLRTYGATSRLGQRSAEQLTAERAGLFDTYAQALVPNWFVPELLALPVEHVVVSAGNHGQIVDLLERGGLASMFDRVLGVGSPGVPAHQGKADRVAVAALPGAVVLEDSPVYLEGARKLGLATLAVQHGYNDLAAVPASHRVHAHVADIWE